MTLPTCVSCREPVATDCDDRCRDCREVESRTYADWWESEGVADDVWFDAQSVGQTMRADIAEAPSAEEVTAEDARLFSAPVFMTLVFEEYAKWLAESDVSETVLCVPSR